jgi:hypothetical protein
VKVGMEPLDETVDHVRGGSAGRLIVEYGDSSPNRHAIARSAESGEAWSCCYVDEVAFVVAPR